MGMIVELKSRLIDEYFGQLCVSRSIEFEKQFVIHVFQTPKTFVVIKQAFGI